MYGRTRFGSSPDDEWFVVYLLRELTAKYTDLVVRYVCDSGNNLLKKINGRLFFSCDTTRGVPTVEN